MIAECQPLACMDGYQAGIFQHARVVKLNGVPVVTLRQLAKQVGRTNHSLSNLS